MQTIGEAFLLPVIEQMLKQFPLEILGFHADNGSEYVNRRVAEMLNALHIEFTRSRPRRSNDKDYVAYCTSFARSGVSLSSVRRRARLTPCARRGALASNGSNRDSLLSL